MALSTVIALFLPDFGPTERMDGGVGVVIRTTMAAPIVFSLMYWAGRLIGYLIDRLKDWWFMSILTAGIEQSLHNAVERRAKNIAKDIAKDMAKDIAKDIAKDMVEAEREAVKQFMRSKGVSDEDIDAFFHRVSNQD